MRNNCIQNSILTLALLFATLSPAKAAFLDGQTVRFDYLFPTVSNSLANAQAVVGGGLEFPNLFAATIAPGGNSFDINVFDTGLSILFLSDSNVNTQPFNGLRLSDILSGFAAFNTVTINAATNVAGFGASQVSFDTDNVFINLSGLSPLTGNQIVLDLNASAGPGPSPVPEPSTIAGVLSAAVLAVLARRRS